MADVKWIKISVDMFNNRKIKQIRKLPEGDAIIVIWVQILCLAGQTNNNGSVFFSQDIPFTDEMLAVEFDRPITLIRLALATFEKFNMIEIVDNVLLVSNWEKYQSVEELEKIREQGRIRQQRYREKHKLLDDSNVIEPLQITHSNGTDIDIDIDLELDKEKEIIMTQHEADYISILSKIQNYPLDRKKDLEYMKTLEERYPSLDMLVAINKFSDYILDKPFKKKANHRSQINTSFSKYVEWGICLKQEHDSVDLKENKNTPQKSNYEGRGY